MAGSTVDEILNENRLVTDLVEGDGLKLIASAGSEATVLTASNIIHGKKSLNRLNRNELCSLVIRLSLAVLKLNDKCTELTQSITAKDNAISNLKDRVNEANQLRFGSSSQKMDRKDFDEDPDRTQEKERFDGSEESIRGGKDDPGARVGPSETSTNASAPKQDGDKPEDGGENGDGEDGGKGKPSGKDDRPKRGPKTTKCENLPPRIPRGKGSYSHMRADEVKEHFSVFPEEYEGYKFKDYVVRSEYELVNKTVEHRYYVGIYENEYGDRKEVFLPKHPDVPDVLPGTKLIPGTHCRSNMLAQLLLDEYLLYLPNNRESIKLDLGYFDCCTNTLSNWKAKGADILEELYKILARKAREGDTVLHIDETYVAVRIKFEGDGTKMGEYRKKYVWVCVNKGNGIVYFLYDNDEEDSRGLRPLQKFLGTDNVEIVSDAYVVYKLLFGEANKSRHYLCWAHTRSYYVIAAQISKDPDAKWFIKMIGKLYAIEIECVAAHMDADAIAERRSREDVTEIMKQMKDKAEEIKRNVEAGKDHRSDKMMKAINYMLNGWTELQNYRKNGKADIDNSMAERTIRPFTVLRNNVGHFSSEQGIRNCCKMLSIIRTGENANLDMLKYLTAFFDEHIRTGGEMNYEEWSPDVICKTRPDLLKKRQKHNELTSFYNYEVESTWEHA